jgi:asparagine synthase (glutamine-hydrolysing)
MCGLLGMLAYQHNNIVEYKSIFSDLMALMIRRGPDDEGFWSDGQHCSLGFRRLSILDLSSAGHQPMHTPDGRYTLIFNGEMYNFPELKRELEQAGVTFRSTGDAEVVLQALAHWGKPVLARFNGMFALAFYDCQQRQLLLARDHAGIKPLYYMLNPKGLVFASQYNQILAHPWSQKNAVSLRALSLYLRLGYIPAPHALLQNSYMLEPGTWLEVSAEGCKQQGRFFEFPQYQMPNLRDDEAWEAVNVAITNAVKRQMISDVPIGAFLSGGIDSPLVTAKMQAMSTSQVKAFTIGNHHSSFDESAEASVYAQEIGIEHIMEHVMPTDALALLEDVVSACSEPFADYSIFPTLMVSKLARRDVKVILSGDGGDELFWGYVGRFGSVLEKAKDFCQPYWWRSTRWGLKKFLGLGNGYWNLRLADIGDWYRAKHTHLAEHWIERIFGGALAWPTDFPLFAYDGWEAEHTAQWLRWNEWVGHLTMVLLKVDRASMYHSLEVRVPLLDKEVIEVATQVDWRSCLRIEDGMGKLPLRYALSQHTGYQTESKKGFTIPMNKWLQTSLRPIFEEMVLSRKELLGVEMNKHALQSLFAAHLSGQSDHSWGLWILLSLALWNEKHYQR